MRGSGHVDFLRHVLLFEGVFKTVRACMARVQYLGTTCDQTFIFTTSLLKKKDNMLKSNARED